MSETTLLYALSTLAQTCAALVAFVGALGLYRLQSLEERRKEAEQALRGLFVAIGNVPEVLHLWPAVRVITDAKAVVSGTYQGDQFASIKIPKERMHFQEEVERWDRVGPDLRRTGRLLILFGGWNLGAILVSLLGFNFLPHLKDRSWASWILGIVATGAVLVTGMMILEILGSFPSHLDGIGLGRLCRWLEREYRGAKQS